MRFTRMKQDKLRKLRISIFAYSVAVLILGGILFEELLSADRDYFWKTKNLIGEYLCDKGILHTITEGPADSERSAIHTEKEKNEISGVGYGESSEKGNGTAYENIQKDSSLLRRYRELNGDVVGIITIPGSILRHPVTQSPERGEAYYLSHDLNLKSNSHGVPFLTLDSDLTADGGTAILYGHNIIWTEPKDIFCDLVNYENLEYYKEHPVIEIVTEKGTAKYLIFLYALIDTSDPDAFVYWENTDWKTEEEFAAYMKEMERRNWLDVPVDYSLEDTFLTISTCSKELAHSGTNRMVLMAKRLMVGEDYMPFVLNAGMSESPYLPSKLRRKQ